jgi:hypothetical protein
MGLRDLFSSHNDAKIKAQFAQAVAVEFQSLGLELPARYDDVNFALIVGDLRPPVAIFLSKAFRDTKLEDYARLPHEDQHLFVSRFTTAEKRSVDAALEARTCPRDAQSITRTLELATKTAHLLAELRRSQQDQEGQVSQGRAGQVTRPLTGIAGADELDPPPPAKDEPDDWQG